LAFRFKIYSRHYECLSTDIKLIDGVENGSTCTEIDTGDEFVFSGTSWVPKIVNTKLNGSLANVVTLQSNAVATGNGTAYTPESPMTLTFEISGTSTSRTIVFELAGPKGVYVAHPAIKVGDATYTAVTNTTLGNDTTPASYEVDIPANYSFRARVSAIAGGDVDIAGWAVAQ